MCPESPFQARERSYDCLTLNTAHGTLDLSITGPDKDGDYDITIGDHNQELTVWLAPAEVARLKEWL